MSASHRHLGAAELVEPGSPRLRLRAAECPVCAERLARVASWRSRVQASLGDPAPAPEFTARVLARTTREDFSWRGELDWWRRSVVGELRRSRALRWLAAGVVIHLAALPVLAAILTARVGDEGPQVDPRHLPDRSRFQSAPRLDTPMPLCPDPVALAHENGLQWARWQWERLDLPNVSGLPLESQVDRLLAARAARPSAAERGRAFAVQALGPNSPALERALACEVLLDHLMLAESQSQFDCWPLEHLLSELGRDRGASEATRELERLALERARGYGLLARAGGLSESGLRELDPRPSGRRLAPLDPRWFAALEAALGENGVAEVGVARRWIEWNRARSARAER